jgi:hypothetical protein
MRFESRDLAVHLLPQNPGPGCTPSPPQNPGPNCTPSPPQAPECGPCTPSPEPGKPKPSGFDALPLGLLRQQLQDALVQPGAR